jgi:Flp pilus assembly protein TadG
MQSIENKQSGVRKRRQRGSELVEFTLVLLPFLGFTFLTLNIAWAVYTRATLQYAVAQGARYAVTTQTMNGWGQRASIQKVVQTNAFGRLGHNDPPGTSANAWNNIYVDWYIPNSDGSLTPEDAVTGGNCMQPGGQLPIVQVSVQNAPGALFVPFVKSPGMGTLSPITTTAVSWDRVEASAISTGGYVCPAM